MMKRRPARRDGASNRLRRIDVIGNQSVHQRVVVDVTVPTHIRFVGRRDELHATAVRRGGIQWQPDAEAVRDDFGVPVGFILMPGRFSAVSSGFQYHVPAAIHALCYNVKQLRGKLTRIAEIGCFSEFGKRRFRSEYLRQRLASGVRPRPCEIEISALFFTGALTEELVVYPFQPLYFSIRCDTLECSETRFHGRTTFVLP